MKAFVASGGASRGQYIVGALNYLLTEKNVVYDIFSGVSIGAIITGFAAQYKKGDESNLIKDLLELSLSIETADVHKRWFLGYMSALWKTGARSSGPLRKLITNNFSVGKINNSGRLLRIGATKISGSPSDPFTVFTEKSPYIVDAIIASSALSPMLEAHKIKDNWYIDGGFQSSSPISAAIAAGATDIDVCICYPKNMTTFDYGSKLNTVDITKRVLELVTHKLLWSDYRNTLYINKLVSSGAISDKKYVNLRLISPKEELSVNSLEFDPGEAKILQGLGFSDAKVACKTSKV